MHSCHVDAIHSLSDQNFDSFPAFAASSRTDNLNRIQKAVAIVLADEDLPALVVGTHGLKGSIIFLLSNAIVHFQCVRRAGGLYAW